MRLEPLPPARLPLSGRAMHHDMTKLIAEHLSGFVSAREDGALIGPFCPLLRFPRFGEPTWGLIKKLIATSRLPAEAREVAVLLTGAQFDARYEIYSHEHVASGTTLSGAKIATLSAGQRPADLTEQESAAFDVTAALLRGRQLPESTYRRAVASFGEDETAELVFLIGGYSVISLLLNAYDMSVPGRE